MPFIKLILAVLVISTASAEKLDEQTSERLNHYIAALSTDLQQHQWDSLISKADPEHYNEQRQHTDRWGYIAGILGVDFKSNHIAGGKKIDEAALQKIQDVQILKVQYDNPVIIEGRIDLHRAESLKITIIIIFKNDRFMISGAFG